MPCVRSDRFVLGDIKPVKGMFSISLGGQPAAIEETSREIMAAGDMAARLTLATEWKKADAGGLRDFGEWGDSVDRPSSS